MNEPVLIPLEDIEHNPYQPRKSEDPAVVAEIAESIERNGLMQIPTARLTTDGRYQLAFGHTRLAAFKQLLETVLHDRSDFAKMPVMLRDLTDLQMFELGVAENIKRRDLNPIELARAMQTYLDPPFSKTSEQAGEFFNVSAETVRGTVRLLHLPAPIQEKVRSGDVSIASARKILTALRIDPKATKSVQRDIAQLDGSSTEAVDRSLEHALEHSPNVVEMWRDHMRGEPRGGDGLWPLGWQHNGRLEPLGLQEIAAVLHMDKKEALAKREVAEGLAQSLAAGMHIDQLQLGTNSESDMQRLEHLANPPTCLTCPLYTKLDDEHFCGMKACWERKRDAWLQLELTRLVQKMDVPAYDPEKDGKQVVIYGDDYGDLGRAFHEALAHKTAPEHAGLRLQILLDGRFMEFPATKHPLIAVIDVAGKVKAKRGAAAGQTNEQKRNQRRRQNIKLSEAFVNEIASPTFAQVFSGIRSLEALLALTSHEHRDAELKGMKDAAKRKFLQAEMMHDLLVHSSGILPYPGMWSENVWTKGPVAMAKYLQPMASSWGVKLPKDWLAQAKSLIPKDVSTETAKGKSTKKRGA